MKNISSFVLRQWMFYSATVLAVIVTLIFQNCGKVKFSVPRQPITPQSCGTIQMKPAVGIYQNTNVEFEVVPQIGITISDVEWDFTKDSNSVFTSTNNPVTHTFNSVQEGPGEYVATVTYEKSDGNPCELTKAFQILDGDLCRDPSGISGPSIGYVGEETSPFSVNREACFQGIVSWDMENDGITEHTVNASEEVTHIYDAVGNYTVRAAVVNVEDNSQIVLTHTIEIRNQLCQNGAINPPSCDHCPTGTVYDNGQCVSNKDCPSLGLRHGESKKFFSASTVQCGQQCKAQTRTCNNGVVSGDASFKYDSCKENGCQSCKLSGVTITHNETRTFYDNTNVGCGDGQPRTCSAGERGCKNGVLTGESRFSAVQCLSASCPRLAKNCTLDGVTVKHGESYKFFKSSSVACDASCVGQLRKCTNGVLSGSDEYKKAKCNVQTCPKEFEVASCQFGLKSSDWSPRPPNVVGTPEGCEWIGEIRMGSSRQVDATFFIGDYYDSKWVARLRNPEQWTISATGCELHKIFDPDRRGVLPNYCQTSFRSYSGTPLVFGATITAVHKTTGQRKVVPLKATFKPKLLDANNGSSSFDGPSGGGISEGRMDSRENYENQQAK